MPTTANWRVLAVALATAAVLIIAALFFAERAAATPAIVVPTTPTVTDSADVSWKTDIESLVPAPASSLADYRAPKELPPTDAMGRELLAAYLAAKQDGVLTEAEKRDAVASVLSRNAPSVIKGPTYSEADLVLRPDGDIVAYAGTLTEILSRSTAIREYELKTFSKSVGERDRDGSPVLQRATAVYEGIARDLKLLPVPAVVLDEHLALVNHTVALAHATKLMAEWSGDPTLALAYIDAFLRAERDLRLSINMLYRTLAQVAQQT